MYKFSQNKVQISRWQYFDNFLENKVSFNLSNFHNLFNPIHCHIPTPRRKVDANTSEKVSIWGFPEAWILLFLSKRQDGPDHVNESRIR